jgi:ATP-dependent Zn protease
MGGMAAEEIFFGEPGTGPSGDLAGATRLAAQMVGAYGMASSLISLEASRAPGDLVSKALSDEPSRQAMEAFLVSARQRAQEILTAQRHVVEALRDALLERDELIGDEIAAVIQEASERGADAAPRLASVIDVRNPAPDGEPPVLAH